MSAEVSLSRLDPAALSAFIFQELRRHRGGVSLVAVRAREWAEAVRGWVGLTARLSL